MDRCEIGAAAVNVGDAGDVADGGDAAAADGKRCVRCRRRRRRQSDGYSQLHVRVVKSNLLFQLVLRSWSVTDAGEEQGEFAGDVGAAAWRLLQPQHSSSSQVEESSPWLEEIIFNIRLDV